MPLKYNPFAGDLLSVIEALIKREIYNLQTCIPAIVKKVIDRNTVIVSPAIELLNSKRELIKWADITVPIHTPSAGGFLISFPVKAGDCGWLMAGDVDPSLFLETPTRPAAQNIFTRHNYQFGYFMPSNLNKTNVDGHDAAFIISSVNGDTLISIEDGKINITSKSELNINAENVNISGDKKIYLNGKDWETHTHTVPANITVQTNPTSGAGATTESVETGGVN